MKQINIAKNNFLKIEENYSKYASKSSDSIRLETFNDDYRTSYFRDVDRIINALSYNRYAGKTQVYPFAKNDHVSERMIHVQLVSKIARSIGRALNLNTDFGVVIYEVSYNNRRFSKLYPQSKRCNFWDK